MYKALIRQSYGFTLIELLAVVVIAGILVWITIPIVTGFKDTAEAYVCETNRKQLERMYEMDLLISNDEHSEDLFIQFINANNKHVCPELGVYNYEEEKVVCNIHNYESSKGTDVPYL